MAQAASNVIPFAFEDRLVRVVQKDNEPWFVGKDVCAVLEIKNHNHALGRLDGDERSSHSIGHPTKGVANDDPLCASGNEQMVTIVSEPGVYRLIFTSRRPEAERFKRWLAHDVLPRLRKTGKFETAGPPEEGELAAGHRMAAFEVTDEAVAMLRVKLDLVNSARRLFGHERAKSLWHALDLPHMYDLSRGPVLDEAHELIATLALARTDDGARVEDLLKRGFEDDETAIAGLRAIGMAIEPDDECVLIANTHPAIRHMLRGTQWEDGWWQVLARIGGVTRGPRLHFGKALQRTRRVPYRLFDPRLD